MSTLSKKFLAGLGIDEDKADLICERHKEVLNEIITERDELKEKAEKYDDAQTQLNKYKKAEQDAANNGEKDPWKVKYDALKEEFDNYKTGIETEKVKAQKTEAYKQLLKNAGVSEKRIDAVIKVSDVDSIEFDEKGNVKDSDKITEGIKAEWSDFIQTSTTEGAKTPNPPASNGGEKKDLGKMSMAEYIQARKDMK